MPPLPPTVYVHKERNLEAEIRPSCVHAFPPSERFVLRQEIDGSLGFECLNGTSLTFLCARGQASKVEEAAGDGEGKE